LSILAGSAASVKRLVALATNLPPTGQVQEKRLLEGGAQGKSLITVDRRKRGRDVNWFLLVVVLMLWALAGYGLFLRFAD
jgi:hypothetical protein